MDHKLHDVPRRRRSVHDVTRLEFCRDIRNDGGHARREFEEIVRRFERRHENQSRGWPYAAPALVGVHDDADKEVLEVLGSIRPHAVRQVVFGSPLAERTTVIESGGATAR